MTEKNRDVESSSSDDDSHNNSEEEVTMDTPGPTPIEPPPEAVAEIPFASTATAVPVTDDDAAGLESTTAQSPFATTPRTCTVYAPATLGPGYTFTAKVDDIDFIVTALMLFAAVVPMLLLLLLFKLIENEAVLMSCRFARLCQKVSSIKNVKQDRGTVCDLLPNVEE